MRRVFSFWFRSKSYAGDELLFLFESPNVGHNFRDLFATHSALGKCVRILFVAHSERNRVVQLLVRLALHSFRTQIGWLDLHVLVALTVAFLAVAFQALCFVDGLTFAGATRYRH